MPSVKPSSPHTPRSRALCAPDRTMSESATNDREACKLTPCWNPLGTASSVRSQASRSMDSFQLHVPPASEAGGCAASQGVRGRSPRVSPKATLQVR